MSVSRDRPGYKTDAVEAWIAAHVPSLRPPFDWKQLKGGHSNLTYLLTDQMGARAVIRRPPEGELLPKAHDMSREWALISALDGTKVPAARPIAFCESPDVTGAHFYLMSAVDGFAMHNRADVEAHLPEPSRADAAYALMDALCELHLLQPDEIGLGNFAKRSGYIERQIRAWQHSWESAVQIDGDDDPRGPLVKEFLENRVPPMARDSVVHGDFGFHNVLLGSDFAVTAILDWEIATLGDPLADLAYVLNGFPDRNSNIPIPEDAIAAAPGFPDRAALAAHYADRTGISVAHLNYYEIFNHWKSASIIKGVCARYQAGAKSDAGVDIATLKDRIERALLISERMVCAHMNKEI